MRILSVYVVLGLLLPLSSSAQNRLPEQLLENEVLASQKPFLRNWWAWSQRAYPKGVIPAGAQRRGFEQTLAVHSPDSMPSGTWTSIGPTPIESGPFRYSGRIADVAIDPSDGQHWLIGAAQGGIWSTIDGGSTWTALTDDQPSLAMGSIAFAASQPSIIYAGTGESAFSSDAYAGAGILKSIDGGSTWFLIAASTFEDLSFADVHVDPSDPDTVVVATTRGLIASFTGGLGPPEGIYRTTNGGTDWALESPAEAATDLEVDPGSFARQYMGIGEIFGSDDNGVYRSTDGGKTWIELTGIGAPWTAQAGGVGRIEIAIAPSATDTVFVGVMDAFDGAGSDGTVLGLWRADDAWSATPTWTEISTGGASGICGSQCWYDFELAVDPADPDILFAGGVSLWRCNGCDGLAHTWSSVLNSGVHVDQHSFAFVGSRIVVGNDGGLFSSVDQGSSWTQHNSQLTLTQFYHGSLHPSRPFALGGAQDNGTMSWSGIPEWTSELGGDGADNAISAFDPDNDWAVSFQFLGIVRTLDGGGNFDVATSGIDLSGAPFIAVFENCRSNDDVMIAGTNNLWRSDNFFGAGPPSWTSNGDEMGESLRSMAFAPADGTCGTYAFGTFSGELRITSNAGLLWDDLDPSEQVPTRYITDLAFDPNDVDTLYATISGFGPEGHLFRTRNATSVSATWESISPPVDLPLNTIVATSSDHLWVASELGIWETRDGGISWSHHGPDEGLPNVAIYDLQYAETTGELLAFTHGRGTFRFATNGLIFDDGFESGTTSAWD